MAFCGNCGTKMEDNVRFCPSCGTDVGGADAATPAPAPEQAPIQPIQAAPVEAAMPIAPQEADSKDAQDNKTMGILAYILFFIPLINGCYKTSPFAKFHTNQGIILAIAAAAYAVCSGILSTILGFIPFIGWILVMLLSLVGFAFPVFCIIGMINASKGLLKPLPLIGKFTILK